MTTATTHKRCSKCGAPPSVSSRYCNPCHAEYMRNWRKKINRPMTRMQKHKAQARSYVKGHVKRGFIIKKPCEKCGDHNSEMHHQNYKLPILVNWLCKKHHLQVHNQQNVPRDTFPLTPLRKLWAQYWELRGGGEPAYPIDLAFH